MKTFKITTVVFLSVILLSCEAEEKFPIPFHDEPESAPFVSWDIETPVIDFTDIENSAYGGLMYVSADNVESHTLTVNRISNGVVSDTVPLRTIETFPQDVFVDAQDLADALGIDVSDFEAGDQINFFGMSVGEDGGTLDLSNITTTVLSGDGALGDLNQAYRLTTFFSCPFNIDNAVGTYTVTTDSGGFVLGDGVFEVVAGPGPNQITLINPLGHPNPVSGGEEYKVIVNVNPVTAAATVSRQNAWHWSNFAPAPAYGVGRVDGGGFAFSCVGTITFNLNFTVAAGSFGNFPIVAQKN